MSHAPSTKAGIQPERLPREEYARVFCDLQPPLTATQAEVESSRCYYCYDAPCIQACPTQIDIPSFIRKIGNRNIKGAAMDILSANILGGTCSRVCPVETLCEEACVRNKSDEKPVTIGQLQRFATDSYFTQIEKTKEKPFTRAPSNGMKIAVVGAGPAGLSCAHQLSRLGYEVTIFESKAKGGGLNEYGLAPYKMVNDFAQKELQFVLSLGGIHVEYGRTLGKDLTLDELRAKYKAVFLGVGLSSTNTLGVPGEDLPGVMDAVRAIETIRQSKNLAQIPVGRNVVVIGGGNTAIDIAIQIKRLGAESVTLVYRRGLEHMGATEHEQELAQLNGVLIKPWAKPVKIEGSAQGVTHIEFEYTRLNGSKLEGIGDKFKLPADQIYKAIGQTLSPLKGPEKTPDVANGKIQVNDRLETSLSGVYAGGDCIALGEDLTVTSVQQGKLAAQAIHAKLTGTSQAGGKNG